jgi:hypothetical protein
MTKSITALLLVLSVNHAIGQLKVTRAQNTSITKDFYIFVDNIPDDATRQQIIQSFAANTSVKIFESAADKESPLIITKSAKGLVKDNAGRDCLIGVGGCALGYLFVQATGKTLDPNTPPSGFFATAGTKYVEGGGAGFVGAMWTASCVFGIKGIVEIFRPATKEKAIKGALNLSAMTTEKIIANTMLFKASEQSFEATATSTSDVVAFINSQMY